MTTSEFLFSPADAGEQPTEAGPGRRKLLVVVAAVLVLAAVAYFVLLPMLTKKDTPTAFVPRSRVTKKVAAKGTKAVAKKKAKTVAKPAVAAVKPATFDDAVSRDPFHPLYVAPKDDPAAATAAVPGGSVPGSVPAAPTGTTGATGSTTGSKPSSATAANGARVSLLHVYAKDGKSYAQTKVNSTVYSPVVGEVFGSSFKLLSTQDTCASYMFGDEPFTLCEGQEVLK
jgi:hypothetical protein